MTAAKATVSKMAARNLSMRDEMERTKVISASFAGGHTSDISAGWSL
jgi:hypothetical protein